MRGYTINSGQRLTLGSTTARMTFQDDFSQTKSDAQRTWWAWRNIYDIFLSTHRSVFALSLLSRTPHRKLVLGDVLFCVLYTWYTLVLRLYFLPILLALSCWRWIVPLTYSHLDQTLVHTQKTDKWHTTLCFAFSCCFVLRCAQLPRRILL